MELRVLDCSDRPVVPLPVRSPRLHDCFGAGHGWSMAYIIYDAAFREPERFGLKRRVWPWTIRDAIEQLTGNRLEGGQSPVLERYRPWWSGREDEELVVPPAYSSTYVTYWFRRDLVKHWFPRARCFNCGQKIPLRGQAAKYLQQIRESRSVTAPRPRICTSRWEKLLDGRYPEAHQRFLEHEEQPFCSRECHLVTSDREWQECLKIKEMAEWIRTGSTSIAATRRAIRSRSRPSSHSVESRGPETFETSSAR